MTLALVAGALANKPGSGGEAWVRLSWVLGLRRLGWEVHFVELLPGADPAGRRYFEEVVEEFDLAGRASLLGEGGEALVGRGERELTALAAEADLLFNISGHLPAGPLRGAPRQRVYVDLDPGFTQAWAADAAVEFDIGGHERYLTVGQNIGRPGCPVPAAGVEWVPTLPPVLLEQWPVAPDPAAPLAFTTVATWRSPFGALQIDGRATTLKHHQFRRFASLPERVEGVELEVALDIHPGDAADLELLRGHGWRVVDPREETATPEAYRAYVQRSAAEFSVAQGVYVEARTGWFSDRTAAYLAGGRPAVVQDTGLEGPEAAPRALFDFDDVEGAVAAIEAVKADYEQRSRAAREFAEAHLDSDRVLGRVLEILGQG